MAAADPDAKLDKTKTYTVSSAANSDSITASSDLVTVLTTDLGLMETGAFGTGGVSTSKYQSTAYRAKAITLELDYNSTSKLWVVTFSGVDNSGAVTP